MNEQQPSYEVAYKCGKCLQPLPKGPLGVHQCQCWSPVYYGLPEYYIPSPTLERIANALEELVKQGREKK